MNVFNTMTAVVDTSSALLHPQLFQDSERLHPFGAVIATSTDYGSDVVYCATPLLKGFPRTWDGKPDRLEGQ